MKSYDQIRKSYLPKNIHVLLIAESPPPAADVQSSRHFYRTDRLRADDRLFVNTIKALFPSETANIKEADLEKNKKQLLKKFQTNGYYMIEALEESQVHEITKKQRQERIRQALPHLLERVKKIANKKTKIVLIKSNVFEVAAEPLRAANYQVLNTRVVDFPGRYNQRAYRQKLSDLLGR